MTAYQEKHTLGAVVGMSFGWCVMLRNMMDGFQTKTEFEERAAERLRADDGWIGQLHRLATAHSAHNTTHHSTKKMRKNQEFWQETPPYTHTEMTKLPHTDFLKYTNSESCTWCVYCTAASVKI